jgi:hypothetical protein
VQEATAWGAVTAGVIRLKTGSRDCQGGRMVLPVVALTERSRPEAVVAALANPPSCLEDRRPVQIKNINGVLLKQPLQRL